MKMPTPYENYADQLQSDVNRIREDWSQAPGKALMLTALPGFMLFALVVATSIADTQALIPDWIGDGLLVVVFMVLLIKIAFQWKHTAASVVQKCYSEVGITCPHCQQQLDLTQVWQCGWCSILNNQNMLLAPSLIFDGCSHKGRHRPTAIRCSHCETDIIRDKRSYIKVQETGAQDIEGVATFVTARQENLSRASYMPSKARQL